jgi:hypothetical protein
MAGWLGCYNVSHGLAPYLTDQARLRGPRLVSVDKLTVHQYISFVDVYVSVGEHLTVVIQFQLALIIAIAMKEYAKPSFVVHDANTIASMVGHGQVV